MQKPITGIIISGALMLGCNSYEKNIFRAEFSSNSSIEGSFKVRERDLYSVSIENDVSGPIRENREKAWNYLNYSSSKETLAAHVLIQRMDKKQDALVMGRFVINPKITSWSNEKLYIELAQVELLKGKYRLRIYASGKNLDHDSFSSSIVVEHAYTGK
ncbi:hypothetical protein [Luteimonas salinilitoris]|uniref:DUF4625 domain-containing protein n=1 Tax=Luteimonas salinilitoris TaxID=3237697 RepID=A0ABV4HV59_9GAMM